MLTQFGKTDTCKKSSLQCLSIFDKARMKRIETQTVVQGERDWQMNVIPVEQE